MTLTWLLKTQFPPGDLDTQCQLLKGVGRKSRVWVAPCDPEAVLQSGGSGQ